MYVSRLECHIRPLVEHRALSSLRRSDVAVFVAALVGRGLKPPTVRGIYDVLAMVLRSAVYDQLRPVSPCYRNMVPPPTARTLEVFTPAQVRLLLAAAWDCDHAAFATAVGTGLRQADARDPARAPRPATARACGRGACVDRRRRRA